MHQNPALVIAHPGHELVVFGWLEECRPVVSILTDGSGRNGTSRLRSTLKLLGETGAEPGELGGIADRDFYEAILEGEIDRFVDLALKLADHLAERTPPYVAGDAREGFNPTHDVCRMIIDAAVARAQRGGAVIGNYQLSLFEPHDRQARQARQSGICRSLDEAQLRRKVAAAHAYPELAGEVEWAFRGTTPRVLEGHPDLAETFHDAIDGMNEASFATECLLLAGEAPPPDERPFYERYGERLVAEGKYERAIRYRDHVQPIERALAKL